MPEPGINPLLDSRPSWTERKPNTWLYRVACPLCSYKGKWGTMNQAQGDARWHRRHCHA